MEDKVVGYCDGRMVYCVHCVDADPDLVADDLGEIHDSTAKNDMYLQVCDSCDELLVDI
jgi:hypothetical protein